MTISNKGTRFYIWAIALIPFIVVLATGIILLKYHGGASPDTTILGQDADFWFPLHRFSSITSFIFIALHLTIKTNWLKQLFSFRLKEKYKTTNILLFVVFLLCALTAFAAWLIFPDSALRGGLGGIHNKLGLLLIVLFAIHIFNYWKVIKHRFKR